MNYCEKHDVESMGKCLYCAIEKFNPGDQPIIGLKRSPGGIVE